MHQVHMPSEAPFRNATGCRRRRLGFPTGGLRGARCRKERLDDRGSMTDGDFTKRAPAPPPTPPEEGTRLDLYRYVSAENAAEYLALMRLFTGTLLADLSATEAQDMLANTGVLL